MSKKVSNKEIIAQLLREHGRVTIRMLGEHDVLYTARNRIVDLKKEGWVIDHYFHRRDLGETHSDNAYIFVSEPPRKPNLAPVKIVERENGQFEIAI